MLSGIEIANEIERGNIVITPFDPKRINPNSYNLRLSDTVLMYDEGVLDSRKQIPTVPIHIGEDGLLLEPGFVYLGETVETTYTPKYVPTVDGRSSVGRLGLFVHVSAGFGDVGFRGKWTLELHCVQPVIVYPFTEICQIRFEPIQGEVRLYDGKYQNANGAEASKFYRDFV